MPRATMSSTEQRSWRVACVERGVACKQGAAAVLARLDAGPLKLKSGCKMGVAGLREVTWCGVAMDQVLSGGATLLLFASRWDR